MTRQTEVRGTRRVALRTALAVLPATIGAACGFGGLGEPPGSKRTEPITLDAWTRQSDFQNVAELYAKGPGQADLASLAVTRLATPLEFQEKLLAAVAANTPPDFTTIEVNITPLFNVRKIYADVSKEFSQLRVKDQLPAGLLRYCQFEGKTYQLPYEGGGTGLYWNKNLFERAGLPPDRAPRTWDEMIDAAVKTTRATPTAGSQAPGAGAPGQVWGITIPYNGSPTFEFMPWVYANGGKLLTDDGKKSAVNTEEGAGAFILWHDLAQRRQVTPDGFRTGVAFNAGELFRQGRLAMYPGGTSHIATLKRDFPDLAFGTAVRPIGPRGSRTGCAPGGETIGFLPNNRYRAETWRLMEWLIGSEVQVDYKVAVNGATPILSGQYDNKFFREEPRFLPFREAQQAITPTWTTRFEDLKAVMLPAYMGTMRGEKEPRAALREMAEEMDRILASP